MSASRHITLFIADMQDGGAQRVAAMLCNEWVARGDRVTILTYEEQNASAFYKLDTRVELHNLELMTSSKGLWQAFKSNVVRVQKVRKALRALKPDVVLAFGAEVTVIGVMATQPLGLKVIACERTDPAVYPTGIWRKLRNWAYPKAIHVVCQTHRAASFFSSLRYISVIPNPVIKPDISGSSDIAAPKGRFIVSMGRLSKEKGHDILVEAFAEIATDHPDVDLLLIGEGPARSNLESLIEKKGLQGRVHLPGNSKNPFPVLAKADIFVLPSRFEGFPNALCEAMALGLPCIATDAAIGAQAVLRDGENGLLVRSERPVELAEAIKQLLEDKTRAAKLGKNASEIVNELSMESVLKQWDRLLP